MNDEIDEAQMAADFASIPDISDGPMKRARKLVMEHIERYAQIPFTNELVVTIGIELGLVEILGADRARKEITTGQLFNMLLSRINFDGMDPRTFSLAELHRAIKGAEWPVG